MKSLKGNRTRSLMDLSYGEGTDFSILLPDGDIIALYRDGRSFLGLYGDGTLFRICRGNKAYTEAELSDELTGEEIILLPACKILGCEVTSPVEVDKEGILYAL